MPSLSPALPSALPERHSGNLIASRYELREQIARGGMGMVYRVFDRSSGVERALKRVSVRNPARRTLYTSAFEREYQVLAGLDHPRIIRVFDYGVDAEGPFYTMELVRGRDLESAAPLGWREVCVHMRDVAASLSLLHARRLLHRDLSPGNVKIGEDGHCKLLDFGALADFGVPSFIVGTPPLVPPEALRGDPLDQRADLYSLGALAYWSLTGDHAYPAARMDDLPMHWENAPRPPSSLVPDIPKALDALVLSLLSSDPLARPTSAAEVITRLNVIGQLAPADEAERRRLAQSFLIVPPFVGRDDELEELGGLVRSALNGQGAAVRVEAMSGSGRSRLLEEVGVRAQIMGATVLRADASMHPNQHGTSRALALRLLDALPDVARERGKRYVGAIATLGRDVDAQLNLSPSRPPLAAPTEPSLSTHAELDDWFAEVARKKPLVILIDNVEYCDDASLGLLISLAKRARNESLFVMVAERLSRDRKSARGMSILRDHCHSLTLTNLTATATLALARSLFGDAPNVERFADWLYSRTAGSPLHCIEISRQLIARDVIQHEGGMWALPASRPHVELPEALEDALSIRIGRLGPAALALAQSLSLQRDEPTLELCRLLVDDPKVARASEQVTLALLDELARCDVLYRDQNGYRFSSMALREALVADMDEHARANSHRKLGQAFVRLAGPDESLLRIEAGWHLIKGGEELRGADLIALVLSDGYTARGLSANSVRLGPPSEAALDVYKRHRRSAYQRVPLLVALAQAGYYEEFHYNARYGDEALDVLEDVSGMRLARWLVGWIGRPLALPIALLVAWLRFLVTPRVERTYSFMELLQQLFSTVTALVGAATISLDADRADRIATVLQPFSYLPERSAPCGIYEFCVGLQQIGRENQAQAFHVFDKLAKRFQDPNYYRDLPLGGRVLFVAGTLFARGAFAVFRAHGEPALESAAQLDTLGLKMYSMIASQLRYLYYAHRGELSRAAMHREQVELYAAHVGSAWQVELWEAPALLPSSLAMSDLVTVSRLAHRLNEQSRLAPSLQFYRRLGEIAVRVVRNEDPEKALELAFREVATRSARSYIGWATSHALIAATLNSLGRYQEARDLCERVLKTMTDADREYVTLFLDVDLQSAIADAGLGKTDAALHRVEALIERFRESGHPLALGSLYEVRARIAYPLGRKRAYQHSLTQVEHYFRDTGTPALIAKFERLAELSRPQDTSRERPASRELPAPPASDDSSAKPLPTPENDVFDK